MGGIRPPDADALLCERCGYVIEGLDGEGACPECGLQVARSLLGTRRGSWFQRDPHIVSLIRTSVQVLRYPLRSFDEIRVDRDDRLLLWLHAVAAGMLLSILWPLVQGQVVPPDFPLLDIFMLVPVFVVLVRLLIWIGEQGTRFFGRRRGWRISPAIARAICAHAAVGWVLGGVLGVLGWVTGSILESALRTSALGPFRPIVILSPQWMPLVGLLVGMLVFETLSYVGMRRMRFVNTGVAGRGRPARSARMTHGTAQANPSDRRRR